jgi:ABC-2 type transport system permease protein
MNFRNPTVSLLMVLVALIIVNVVSTSVHGRLDLTAEKRFTLSQPTKQLMRNLPEQVNVTVLLDGDLPSGFRKLRNSTQEMLQQYKELGRSKIAVTFSKPGEGMNDTTKNAFLDSLVKLGIKPYNIKAQTKEGEGNEERLIFPAALVAYKGRTIPIDLLSGQGSMLDENSINRAEATLEYKFSNAIRKITQDTVPLIGYMIGNGEPLSYNVYDLVNTLKRDYAFRFFPVDSFPTIPPVFDAMIVCKPTRGFDDSTKFKIDQYVMHGGKILWMIDNLYAEMDSLQRTQNDFIAFDRGLKLEDLFFKYGVRINQDLVQDLNADRIPSVVGNQGGKPQMQLLPWPYFPLLSNYTNHPIAKNLDYVLTQFPNSIDTVKSPGIKKTVLLATSAESRSLVTPAKVSWNSIQSEADLRTFNQKNIPVAVLLEGQFKSLYANRVTTEQNALLQGAGEKFTAQSPDSKMIVIADGDIGLNPISQTDGPLAVGTNMYTKFTYANREFLENCITYLLDNSGILETRGKDYTLRLLDKKKIETEKVKWQVANIVLPIAVVCLFASIFQYVRKRKYQGT